MLTLCFFYVQYNSACDHSSMIHSTHVVKTDSNIIRQQIVMELGQRKIWWDGDKKVTKSSGQSLRMRRFRNNGKTRVKGRTG